MAENKKENVRVAKFPIRDMEEVMLPIAYNADKDLSVRLVEQRELVIAKKGDFLLDDYGILHFTQNGYEEKVDLRDYEEIDGTLNLETAIMEVGFSWWQKYAKIVFIAIDGGNYLYEDLKNLQTNGYLVYLRNQQVFLLDEKEEKLSFLDIERGFIRTFNFRDMPWEDFDSENKFVNLGQVMTILDIGQEEYNYTETREFNLNCKIMKIWDYVKNCKK